MWNEFLPINADYRNRSRCCRRHGVLLVSAPLASLSLAGQEHGRTIPLVDVRNGYGHGLIYVILFATWHNESMICLLN